MIEIKEHANFTNWFNILLGSKLVDQIQGKANAIQVAQKLSRQTGKMIHNEYLASVKQET